MIQFVSLMWACAIFFAILGLRRGWQNELIVTTWISLATYVLFQLDNILRIAILSFASLTQYFLLQFFIFFALMVWAYQTRSSRQIAMNWQSGVLGGIVGFVNGYLIGGMLWYLMDINEYPLIPYVLPPAPNSLSAQAINSMPIILISGGVNGNIEPLFIITMGLFFVMVSVAL